MYRSLSCWRCCLVVAGRDLVCEQASRRAAPSPAAVTAEAKAYVRNLALSGVEMKATENFAGAAVVEITG